MSEFEDWSIEEEENIANQSLKAKDPAKAIELYRLMGQISKERYSVGWLLGLEYRLWKDKDDRIERLVNEAGCWWQWEDDEDFAECIKLEDWEQEAPS